MKIIPVSKRLNSKSFLLRTSLSPSWTRIIVKEIARTTHATKMRIVQKIWSPDSIRSCHPRIYSFHWLKINSSKNKHQIKNPLNESPSLFNLPISLIHSFNTLIRMETEDCCTNLGSIKNQIMYDFVLFYANVPNKELSHMEILISRLFFFLWS